MPSKIPLNIVITAAGKGKRMQSKVPKVLLKVAGKSLLQRVVDEAHRLSPKKIFIVVGDNEAQIKAAIVGKNLNFVKQKTLDGTAGAAQVALAKIPNDEKVVVVFGDTLITAEQIKKIANAISANSISIRSMITNSPFGYSRFIRDTKGKIVSLVQEKYLTNSQKSILEVDAGGQGFLANWGKTQIAKIKAKKNKERLLTDLIDMAVAQNIAIKTVEVDENEGIGCNTKAQILLAEAFISKLNVKRLIKQGVLFADPNSVIIRGEVVAGKDVFIDKNVILAGNIKLAQGASVGANAHLINTKLGKNAQIKEFTMAIDSVLEKNAIAGPFAHLREGSRLLESAVVGNFVEVKNTTIGKGSKAKHLSYLGDGQIGTSTNIGAGTVFCNYDGVNKHPTKIGDQVAIGAGSMLVAPIIIGKNAQIAAGSVITKDVKNNQLVFARARQVTKNKKKIKNSKKK